MIYFFLDVKMENQTNVVDQNSQQIGQNPIDQPTMVSEKPKLNYWMISIIVLALLFLGTLSYYVLVVKSQRIQQSLPTPTRQKPVFSPTVFPTTAPTNTGIPIPTTSETEGWKLYQSVKVGYSIKAPPSWKVTPNEDDSLLSDQDYLTNMTLMPESEGEGIIGNSVTIAFPISIQGPHKELGKQFENGLEGLALPSKDEPSSWFTKQESSYTQVDGHRALIKVKVYKSTPPAGFAGGWCDCTHKHVYIDLGNGKILDILGYWQNSNKGFEGIFDLMISTLKFTK